MSKKDFELIAQAINDSQGGDVSTVARAMADALANTNPRFDRVRFLRACGLDVATLPVLKLVPVKAGA